MIQSAQRNWVEVSARAHCKKYHTTTA